MNDTALWLCMAAVIVLLGVYIKTRDKDILYFMFSSLSYLFGELSYLFISEPTGLPVDFIFYFLFYFFIFWFFRQSAKGLLKNPARTGKTGLRTLLILTLDFLIIGMLAFMLYCCFDRVEAASGPAVDKLDLIAAFSLLYPLLDFLFLGYYVYINHIYLMNEKNVYLPMSAGIMLWSVCDFMFAFEELYKDDSYGLGSLFQIAGLLLLAVVLAILKNCKGKSSYTTLDLEQTYPKFGEFSLVLNSAIPIYLLMLLYCAKRYPGSPLLNAVRNEGLVLLLVALLRQTVINCDAKIRMRKLSKDASTDPLTGLYSRKYAFSLMRSLFRSARYFHTDISVLMLDIDHFKAFNDLYGHVSGDRVLQDISAIINSSIETSNIVCRYGGEEYLIILPGAGCAEGLAVAEKVRRSIEAHDFYEETRQKTAKITVSIGGATAGEMTENEISLVRSADEALYRAKAHRDCCMWHGECMTAAEK